MKKFFNSIKDRDPNYKNFIHTLILYPGVKAYIYYKIAHFFYCLKLKFVGELIMYFVRIYYGIEIHPAAKIGKRLFIDHGHGVVIGSTAVIGDDCTIYQGVTLGATGKEKGKRHPTLLNNVLVGANSLILGNIVIGEGVKVGAGSIVLDSIPSGKTVKPLKSQTN